jgi:hypothetical protein
MTRGDTKFHHIEDCPKKKTLERIWTRSEWYVALTYTRHTSNPERTNTRN